MWLVIHGLLEASFYFNWRRRGTLVRHQEYLHSLPRGRAGLAGLCALVKWSRSQGGNFSAVFCQDFFVCLCFSGVILLKRKKCNNLAFGGPWGSPDHN